MAYTEIRSDGKKVLYLTYEESVKYQQYQLNIRKANINACRPSNMIDPKWPEVTQSRKELCDELEKWNESFGEYDHWKIHPDFLLENMETTIPYLRSIVFDNFELPDEVKVYYKLKYPNGLLKDGTEAKSTDI